MANSAEKQVIQENNKHGIRNSISMIREVLHDAREFIRGCKHDLELFVFLRQYEKMKLNRRRLTVRFNRYVSGILLSFPTYWQERLKRYTDLIFTFLGMVVCLPVMVVIAIAVKITSPGPIFYKQERIGKDGRPFIMLKFRTMYDNAEAQTGPVWAQENDDRVTIIGDFLRRTHLDELPQLFNVLRGEMSLVGPRPERPFFVSQLRKEIPDYVDRLHVKPGITGLAQVRHKYDETVADVKKKLKYDLVYIKKMCLTLDMKVIMWTIGVILTGKGAR